MTCRMHDRHLSRSKRAGMLSHVWIVGSMAERLGSDSRRLPERFAFRESEKWEPAEARRHFLRGFALRRSSYGTPGCVAGPQCGSPGVATLADARDLPHWGAVHLRAL
jgi:hypothetical protein